MSFTRYSINRARKLRKEQTEAEKFLWQKLRNRNLGGFKFYRQYPIGWYFLDFFCLEKLLAVELDGSQHMIRENQDLKRTVYLQERGITVIRFWDNEVFTNLDGVLQEITKSLSVSFPPHPDPLLVGEGNKLE